jgi:DNA-binding transcriptional MerR regulator
VKDDLFIFTVTDLARFLGKSAVTIRGWEKRGLIELPRDSGGDRKLTLEDVRGTARIARGLSRITERRLELVEAVCTMMSYLEGDN